MVPTSTARAVLGMGEGYQKWLGNAILVMSPFPVPPIYNVVFYNCNDFVMDHLMDGIIVPPSIQKSMEQPLPLILAY